MNLSFEPDIVCPHVGKRIDECLVCKSRKCNHRIFSVDGGWSYDEIACQLHSAELYEHADIYAAGIFKYRFETTGLVKRGEKVFLNI
jgi:hypothetical protein